PRVRTNHPRRASVSWRSFLTRNFPFQLLSPRETYICRPLSCQAQITVVGFIYVCLHAFRRVAQAVPPVVEMAVLDVLLSAHDSAIPRFGRYLRTSQSGYFRMRNGRAR